MPGHARKEIVREGEIGTYHCWSRCVQQAFLCGEDPVTGQNFEHRRLWIKSLLEYQASVFAVDVGNYTVLSNHQHLIARTRPDIAATWSDEEVAWRWKLAWPSWNGDRWLREPTDEEIEELLGNPDRISQLRANLGSLSWFLARWKEPIAKAANRESEKKGHYYDGRFGSREICDDAANLCCNVYLDLNQLKAGMARSLDDCACSAIQDRLRAWRRQQAQESVDLFQESAPAGYELRVTDVEELLADCFLARLGDQGPSLLLGAADAPSMQGPEQTPIVIHFVAANSRDKTPAAESIAVTPETAEPATKEADTTKADTEKAKTKETIAPEGTEPVTTDQETKEAPSAEPVMEATVTTESVDPSPAEDTSTSIGQPTTTRDGEFVPVQPHTLTRSHSKPLPTWKIHQRLNGNRRPRASDNAFLGLPRQQYLGMVQWAAQQLGAEVPEPPPDEVDAVLRRCGVEPSRWLHAVKHFGELFHRAVGHPDKLVEVVQRVGGKRLHGSRACRDVFT